MLGPNTPHDSIVIDGDADFSATALLEGWPGDGSPGNPYIIDGLDIDLGGADGSCIKIINTQVSFIIRNCSLTGAKNDGEGDFRDQAGIYLHNVMHGKLVKNILDGNSLGISLNNANYSTVTDNICTNNRWSGILYYGSSYTTLANNTCTNNDYGINIRLTSSSNTLTNNICYNNGGGIHVTNSESNTVTSNTCYNNSWGIDLWNANYSIVTDNTCYNNSVGISFGNSNYNTLSNNTCTNNEVGISLDGSFFNTVENNTVLGNSRSNILDVDLEFLQLNTFCGLVFVLTGVIILGAVWRWGKLWRDE